MSEFRILAGDQDVTWQAVLDFLRAEGHSTWAAQLAEQSSGWLQGHGDYARWSAAIGNLPEISDTAAIFDQPAVTLRGKCDDAAALETSLRGLMPWRKGPFDFAGIAIDSEWRSDLKWQRVQPHLASLAGRRVLDVGCGNGYYAWRMLAERPRMVVGIEPSVLFNLQFAALQHYLERPDIGLLPIGIEALPPELELFDTVFSMGVLYHRRSPIDHLYQLRGLLDKGGELCLETLVIDGEAGQVLVPKGRYARMRNVWFLPSVAELLIWLGRCGFEDARVVDQQSTTIEEQRTTDWMAFESLAQALDPADSSRTVEGLPAPKRAILIARRAA